MMERSPGVARLGLAGFGLARCFGMGKGRPVGQARAGEVVFTAGPVSTLGEGFARFWRRIRTYESSTIPAGVVGVGVADPAAAPRRGAGDARRGRKPPRPPRKIGIFGAGSGCGRLSDGLGWVADGALLRGM